MVNGDQAHERRGDVFVAEADESDGSFLAYRTTPGVVSNVRSTLTATDTPRPYRAAFDRFVALLPVDGSSSPGRDRGRWVLASRTERRGAHAHLRRVHLGRTARRGRVETADGSQSGEPAAAPRAVVLLSVPGRHNVLDATPRWVRVALGQPFARCRGARGRHRHPATARALGQRRGGG